MAKDLKTFRSASGQVTTFQSGDRAEIAEERGISRLPKGSSIFMPMIVRDSPGQKILEPARSEMKAQSASSSR